METKSANKYDFTNSYSNRGGMLTRKQTGRQDSVNPASSPFSV